MKNSHDSKPTRTNASRSLIESLEQRQLLAATDLGFTSLNITPASTLPGGVLRATRTYQVAGAASPDFLVQYRLSTDRIWGNADDIAISSYERVSTAAGKSIGSHSAPFNLAVPIRVAAGTYYVLGKLDGAGTVGESNERNNVIASKPITVIRPANDDFAARAALSGVLATASGVNGSATSENGEPYHADLGGQHSVWWTWVAPGTGRVRIDTTGSDFDTVLAVYTGSQMASLREKASNDDAEGLISIVNFDAVKGVAYQIAVDGAEGRVGRFKLNLRAAMPPAAPTGVTASTRETTRVLVGWSRNTLASSYEVWRSTSSSSAAATRIAQNVTSNSYSDTTAAKGTRYWYWVKSKNAAGTSGFSSSAQGVRV